MTSKALTSKWANPSAVSEFASLVECAAFFRNTKPEEHK